MHRRAKHGGAGPTTTQRRATRGCDPRVALAGRQAIGREHGRHAPTARPPHDPGPALRHGHELLPLSRHPLSSASLDLSLEERSDDKGTVRNTLDLLVLSRGLGLLRFLLDTFYAARRQTASTMHPSGSSQTAAYEWGRYGGEACGGARTSDPRACTVS
jgi:hypothetical protein